MKVFANNNFTGHWPVGTAAIVVAEDADTAAKALMQTLKERALGQHIDSQDMIEILIDIPNVTILRDGNY